MGRLSQNPSLVSLGELRPHSEQVPNVSSPAPPQGQNFQDLPSLKEAALHACRNSTLPEPKQAEAYTGAGPERLNADWPAECPLPCHSSIQYISLANNSLAPLLVVDPIFMSQHPPKK